MSGYTGLAALYASTGAAWSRTPQERGTEIAIARFLDGYELSDRTFWSSMFRLLYLDGYLNMGREPWRVRKAQQFASSACRLSWRPADNHNKRTATTTNSIFHSDKVLRDHDSASAAASFRLSVHGPGLQDLIDGCWWL